jgi:tripartite-type tricarboxylate transporter receptor subunit TctC
MTPIKYKGAESAIADLAAGRIVFPSKGIAAPEAQATADRVRLLAVAASKGVTVAPELRTNAEQRLPSLVVASSYLVHIYARVAPEADQRLHDAFAAAPISSVLRERILALGDELADGYTPAFARPVDEDTRSARGVLASCDDALTEAPLSARPAPRGSARARQGPRSS